MISEILLCILLAIVVYQYIVLSSLQVFIEESLTALVERTRDLEFKNIENDKENNLSRRIESSIQQKIETIYEDLSSRVTKLEEINTTNMTMFYESMKIINDYAVLKKKKTLGGNKTRSVNPKKT